MTNKYTILARIIKFRTILKWNLRRYLGRCRLNSYGSEWSPAAAYCEHLKEFIGIHERIEFLDQLNDHQLTNKDAVSSD
jgi:hypothetical protein